LIRISSTLFAFLLSALWCSTASAQLVARPVACTAEAMQCADGSYVSRTGPRCEFSACPKAIATTPPAAPPNYPPGYARNNQAVCNMGPLQCPDGSLIFPDSNCQFAACTATITGAPAAPGPDDGGLQNGPNDPLTDDAIPTTPQSLKFIVEHRTALDGKQVTVHGTIVSGSQFGEPSCGGRQPCLKRVTIADSAGDDRDMNYDVTVLIRPSDQTTYSTGQQVDITGTVSAGNGAVSLRKD